MNTAIIVCGSPGAGKSTYGSKLAAERRALLLDIDTCTEQIIRASLAELGLDTDDRDSDYFKSTFREPIYETLFNINPVSLSFDKNTMTLERARSWSFAPSRAAVKIYPAPIMTKSDCNLRQQMNAFNPLYNTKISVLNYAPGFIYSLLGHLACAKMTLALLLPMNFCQNSLAQGIARENLPNNDVIIVGPFTKELQDPEWPDKLARSLNSTVEVHYLYCSANERKSRLVNRNNSRDRSKLAKWDEHRKYLGNEAPPKFQHKFIDTSKT